MSLKKVVAALLLSSVAAFAWLGLSAVPAAAAPQTELTRLDQQLGLHAKGRHHKKGAKTGSQNHHKHRRHHKKGNKA